MTRRVITEAEFIAEFQPEEHDDGSIYVQRDWGTPELDAALITALQQRRLWTMVEDDDGDPCVVQGYHYVNRLFYVFTQVPHAPDDDIEVECDKPPRCAHCGVYVDAPGSVVDGVCTECGRDTTVALCSDTVCEHCAEVLW